jgi:CheY-like chemotaxis protein
MDINMPVMDGLEASRRIRSLAAPEGARVPIIAMTANVLMSEVDTYLAEGMTDHIGKPVDFDKLLNKLYRYLQ